MFDFARRRKPLPEKTNAAVEPSVPLMAPPPRHFLRSIRLSDLDERTLADCDFNVDGRQPVLALAFISPHLDFRLAARQISLRLPGATRLPGTILTG
jgi:hypothetical protein